MPQLDGVRTLAVGAVIAQHFRILNVGAGYGVHLFFVLSGFLITGILLAERKNVEELSLTRGAAFRHFYIRRALRIFPLYYFIVFSGIILNVDNARDYAPWLLTYTINLKMAAQGWNITNFSHFWSLAVEEQYYIVWPWLILMLPKRKLVLAAALTIAIGPVFRLMHVVLGSAMPAHNSLSVYISTPTVLDSLGMGSLLAILTRDESVAPRLERWMRFAIPLGALAAFVFLEFRPPARLHFLLGDTAAAVLFAWLIYKAARGFGGITGAFLSAAPIVYLGRISYGIYVYHPLVPGLTLRTARLLGISTPQPWDLYDWTPAFIVVTIIVATISWYVLEKPLNGLKNRFPYSSSHSGTTASVPAGS